jgi:hypothetical protein
MGRLARSVTKAELGIGSVTALMQPLDMYVASKTQDEYDARTFAMNMVGALEFGAFVGLVHAPWERLPVRDKALVAQKAMLDIANGKPVDVAEPIKYSSPESFRPITTAVTADMPMERISALNPKAHESIVRNLEVIRSEMVRDMEFNPESKWGGDDYRNVGLMIEGRELEVPIADRQRLMKEAVGEVGKPIGESKLLLEAYRDRIREDMIANPESSAYGSEDWVAVNAIIEGRERGIPEELSTRIKQTALGEKTLTRESFLQPTVLDEAGKVYEPPIPEPEVKGVAQKPTHIVAYVKGQFLDRLEKWTGIVPKEFFMEKNNRMLLDLIHDSEAMDLLLQLKEAGVDRDLIGQFMLNKDALKNLTWEQIRDISPVAGKMAKRFTLFDDKIEKVDVKGEPRDAIASDHVIAEEVHPSPKDDPAPVSVQAQKKLEAEPVRAKTLEQERWDSDSKELEHQLAEFIRTNFDEASSIGVDLHKEVALEKAGYLKAKKKGEVYKQLDICMRA